MSIFSKIGKVIKGAAKGFLSGGPLGAVAGGIGSAFIKNGGRVPPPPSFAPVMSAGMGSLPAVISRLPAALPTMRTLPGAGTIGKLPATIGRAVGTAATAKVLYDQFGNPVVRRRRRRKGITASELKGFKRVACILSDYQKVAKAKNVKAPARRRARSCA